VADERADLVELPEAPVLGLVVVGMSGRAVPLPVWHAVREALEQVTEQDLDALSMHVIDTAPAAGYLADLVTVEETVTMETPRYADPPWQTAALTAALPALPAAVPDGPSLRASASRKLAWNFIRRGGVALPEGMRQDQAVDALVAVAEAAGRQDGEPAPEPNESLTAGLRLLMPASHRVVYARSLPGVPAGLGVNEEFTLDEPATAQAAIVELAAGGTMFMIAEPQALDVSALIPPSGQPGLVIFAPGTSFLVTRTWSEAGGTVIQLAHPADEPATEPASPGDAGLPSARTDKGKGKQKAELRGPAGQGPGEVSAPQDPGDALAAYERARDERHDASIDERLADRAVIDANEALEAAQRHSAITPAWLQAQLRAAQQRRAAAQQRQAAAERQIHGAMQQLARYGIDP
jgi:hypothetical protein